MIGWLHGRWAERAHAWHIAAPLVVLVAALAWAAPVIAQDRTAAAAVLFQEAKKLAGEENWAEACPKFEASYELDEQLGTLMNWADCLENVGQVARAWAHWSDALEWAKRDANTKRITYIEERLQATEPKLAKLTIVVTHPVDALRIRRGDVEVEAPLWGLPIPVDPGTVEVTVLRGDHVLERSSVVAKATEVAVIELDLSEIDAKHPPPPPPKVVPPPAPVPLPVPRAKVAYDPTHRNVGLIMAAVGVAGVLAAAGLEVAALVKKGQADEPDACVNKFCSPDGLAAAESAATFAEVGQWVGIGSLVVLAVGATVFFTAPPDDDDEAISLQVMPWFHTEGGGLAVGARF